MLKGLGAVAPRLGEKLGALFQVSDSIGQRRAGGYGQSPRWARGWSDHQVRGRARNLPDPGGGNHNGRVELQEFHPHEPCKYRRLNAESLREAFHDESLACSSRRLSDEIPALAAVTPARPPSATRAVFQPRRCGGVSPSSMSATKDLITPIGASFPLRMLICSLRSSRSARSVPDRLDELRLGHA